MLSENSFVVLLAETPTKIWGPLTATKKYDIICGKWDILVSVCNNYDDMIVIQFYNGLAHATDVHG